MKSLREQLDFRRTQFPTGYGLSQFFLCKGKKRLCDILNNASQHW